MNSDPLAVKAAMEADRLQEAIAAMEILKADRGLSYWERVREMADDVRSHAATRLDGQFAGGVKVSVYRMSDHQIRIDIQE